MFGSLFKSKDADLPIRVVTPENLAATEDLGYPTEFATFLANAYACRSDAQNVLTTPNEPPQPTDVLPQV